MPHLADGGSSVGDLLYALNILGSCIRPDSSIILFLFFPRSVAGCGTEANKRNFIHMTEKLKKKQYQGTLCSGSGGSLESS